MNDALYHGIVTEVCVGASGVSGLIRRLGQSFVLFGRTGHAIVKFMRNGAYYDHMRQ